MIQLRNIQCDGVPVNLFIQGDRIHRILPFPEEGGLVADEVVDCTGKAVIPGFVNMHTHAAMVLLRGITEDVPLDQWLEKIWAIEAKMDKEFVYWGTRLACLEMIKSGTTTFNDQYWFAPYARQAAVEMGIRPYISSSSWTSSTRKRRNASAASASNCTSNPSTGRRRPIWQCPSMRYIR